MTERAKQEKPFEQVCVWGSTTVGEPNIGVFEKSMLEQYGIRVKYLEEIMTFPDRDANGDNIEGTGGRSDVFFSIHEDDIPSFAIPRLSFDPPVRWIEDVLENESLSIYPETVNNYTSWENDT